MVTAASQRAFSGRCMRSFEALLAPKTLWIAAKCAAPWSWQKYGAKTHPFTHFLRRNLHAPHGEPNPVITLSSVARNWCWLLYSYSLQLVKWSELSSSPFIMEATLAVGLALSVEWFICSGLPNGLQVPLSPSPVPNSIVVWDPFQNDSNGMGGNTDPTISCLLEKKNLFLY